MLFVADKRKNHSNCHIVTHCQSSSKVYNNDVLKPEQGVIKASESNLSATETDISAYFIGITVQPLGLAVTLPIEDLQALHRAHRLDERRIFVSFSLDQGEAALPQ